MAFNLAFSVNSLFHSVRIIRWDTYVESVSELYRSTENSLFLRVFMLLITHDKFAWLENKNRVGTSLFRNSDKSETRGEAL